MVGLGNMGRHHVKHYAEMTGVSLVGVCDTHVGMAAEFSAKFGGDPFTSVDDLLAAGQVDAISITAPTFSHFDIARKALAAGIHCLIEKPISSTVEEADTLIALAKIHHAVLMVGHIERFNPAIMKVKKMIDSGVFGRVVALSARRMGPFPVQIKDANVVIDLAVHDIDICSFLLNRSPESVSGAAGHALIDMREDHAEMWVNYGDASALVQVNWITPMRIRDLRVSGSHAYAEVDLLTQEIVLYETQFSSDSDLETAHIRFESPVRTVVVVEKHDALGVELAHFIDCIRTGGTPVTDGAVGRDALMAALSVTSKSSISHSI